jgi:hypothetical protein
MNGGKPTLSTGSTCYCECPVGYSGQYCQICTQPANPCASSPCINDGLCNIVNSGYICSCLPDWHGVNCEIGNTIESSFELLIINILF